MRLTAIDSDQARSSPGVLAISSARRVGIDLELMPQMPALVWGRDQLGAGEMCNTNSMISWLMARTGLDVDSIHPPAGDVLLAGTLAWWGRPENRRGLLAWRCDRCCTLEQTHMRNLRSRLAMRNETRELPNQCSRLSTTTGIKRSVRFSYSANAGQASQRGLRHFEPRALCRRGAHNGDGGKLGMSV